MCTVAGADAIKDFISNVISTAGNFQKMEAVLANSLGSISKAKETMDMLADFGAKTPFQVDELTSSYVKLANQGFTPTLAQISKLGDLASSTGKSFDQLTEAIIDAQVGENERLKEFGIRASKNGDTITYTFKEQETTVKNTASAIREYILSLGDLEGVAGANEKISATFVGRLSNIEDELTNQFKNFGEKFSSELSGGINSAAVLVENLNKIIPVIGGLVAAYGAYKSAILLVTAAHKAGALYENIRLIGMMRKELGLATAAQQAFNTASKANIYAALLSVLLGIGTAVYMFAKNTNEATDAQKRLSNASVELNTEIGKETKIAKDLFDKLKKAKEGTTEYSDAKKVILDNYGKYISGMNKELDTMEKVKAAYSESTQAIKLYVSEKLKAQFVNEGVGDASGRQAEALKMIRESLNKKYTSFGDAIKGEYNPTKESEEAFKAVKELLAKDDISGAGKLLFQDYGMNFMGEAGKGLEQYKNAADEIKQVFKDADDLFAFDKAKESSTNSEKKAASEWLSSYKKAYEDADKAYNDFLKSKQVMSEADRDKELKRLKELRDTAKTTYEAKGGSASSDNKQESAAEKLREQQEKLALLMDKQALDQARSAEDLQTQVDQARINAMDEGSKKTLAQMELNFEKEMQAIDRQKEDLLRKKIEDERAKFDKKEDENAAKDPKHVKQTFDPTGIVLSDGENKQFDSLYKAQIAEKEKEEKAYLDNLLEKHQDYTDKRLAIEKKFNADIAALDEQRKKAVENGDTQQIEQIDRAKAQATKNKGKELISMDYDKLKESPEYVRAFENLKETSSETLNSLLSQLENAKTAAAKVLSPDQLREYTTTIQDIMNELDERNPFQALSDKKQELSDAEQELAQAQIALENARQTAETVKGGGKVEYTTTKFNQKTGKIDSTKAYLTEAQALENVKTKTDNYNKSKDNAVKASTKVRKSEKEVRDIIDDLSKSISDVGNSIGGPAGEIISLIGNIGSFAMMAMSGVETASKTTSTAIQTVEKASVILAIISAAIQIATKMLDLFGGDDTTEKYESTKEAYESYINILDQVIDKQLEMAESLSGASAQAAYDKAIELVKTQSEAARVLGKQYLNSGASWKTHSKGYEEVEDMSYEGWADAAKALGMSVDQIKNTLGGRMGGLFDLTDEQLAKLQGEAHIFWAQLDDDTQDYANQIAEGVSKVAEVIEQQMADVTLIDVDTLRSDFHDLLTDMDADTADFAGNFEEYMKNAILNSMLKEQYMGRLTEWRKKFYAAMDNGVTEEEYSKLKAEGQQIADDMKNDRDNMKDMYGWTSGESTSQDSTNGGFQSMSQDTGNELNGRFTALQISNEEIKNSMLAMLSGVNLISTTNTANGITLMEIRNVAMSSNSYLEDIAGFQKNIVGLLRSDLGEIKQKIKTM